MINTKCLLIQKGFASINNCLNCFVVYYCYKTIHFCLQMYTLLVLFTSGFLLSPNTTTQGKALTFYIYDVINAHAFFLTPFSKTIKVKTMTITVLTDYKYYSIESRPCQRI